MSHSQKINAGASDPKANVRKGPAGPAGVGNERSADMAGAMSENFFGIAGSKGGVGDTSLSGAVAALRSDLKG